MSWMLIFICSKLTVKMPERPQLMFFSLFTVNANTFTTKLSAITSTFIDDHEQLHVF